MKKYNKAQLNAISRAYTLKRNKEALDTIFTTYYSPVMWFMNSYHKYHISIPLLTFVSIYRRANNLKSDSYVVLLNNMERKSKAYNNNPKAFNYQSFNDYLCQLILDSKEGCND